MFSFAPALYCFFCKVTVKRKQQENIFCNFVLLKRRGGGKVSVSKKHSVLGCHKRSNSVLYRMKYGGGDHLKIGMLKDIFSIE